MLSTKPEDMLIEIRAAEELRKKFTTNTTTLIRRYVGNWYRSDQRTRHRPENMIYSFLADNLPDLVFDNPGVTVDAKQSITHEPIASAMEMGLNAWVKEVQLRTELEKACVDMLLGYGCMKVGLEERTDAAGGHGVQGQFNYDALMPYAVRLPPSNVVIDAQALGWHAARFIGHMFQRDLSDLQGDDRYDQTIVAKLTADDEKPLGAGPAERAFQQGTPAASVGQRGRVTLYEIYFPESRQIGTLSLSMSGDTMWIRPLADFHGPRGGPFVLFGVYMVPDQVYPLSPIAALAEQDQELNAHATAAAKEAATAKSLLLVDANMPEAAAEIQRAENNSVIKIKGLNGQNVVPVALGGTTEQRIAYLNLLLQRVDRNSGQSEAARGKAQGVTATEANLAHVSADARIEFVHLKFRDSVKDVLTCVGYYYFHDPAVVAPVSRQDPSTGSMFEGIFLGGTQPGQEHTDWAMFMLDIEPMSMRRVDPAVEQQRAQLALELVTTIAPLIPQTPYINWSAVLDLIGHANNMPDFAKQILNPQGLAMIGAGMMPGVMPGAGPAAASTLPPGTNPQLQQAAGGAPVGAQPTGPGAQPMQAPQLPAQPPAATDAAQMALGKRFGGGLASPAQPWAGR